LYNNIIQDGLIEQIEEGREYSERLDREKYRFRRRPVIKPDQPKLINKKGAPEKPYVHRLGYHSVVSNYTGGNIVSRLSGSSINRKLHELQKDQKEAIGKTKKDAIKKVKSVPVGRKLPAWVLPGLLSQTEIDNIRNRKRVSSASGRKLPRIHVLSGRSKQLVKGKCTAFYRSCPGRKTLCTLTFINDVSDAAAVRILNKFFTVLRKEFTDLQYIWIAERQLLTTNRIHFHIIINAFLPIKRFNALWIVQQYNAGICHPKYSLDEILWYNNQGRMQEILNPVDVKRVKNISMLSSYLTKYITKGNNKGGFGCLAWHCSRQVSQLFLRVVCDNKVVDLARSVENARFNRSTGEFFGMPQPVRERSGTKFFYTIWYLNQPGRFLPFLRELEEINKYIMAGDVSPDRVMQYLAEAWDEDHSRLN
jgi:hypothetical protein